RVIASCVCPEALTFQPLIDFVANLAPTSRSMRIRTMRFLIAASLLRSRWHLGEPFDDARVRAEFSQLHDEMLSDGRFRPQTRAFVYCSDFLLVVPQVLRLTKGRAVM